MDQPTAAFVRFRAHGDLKALGEVFDAQAPRLLALALHLCGNAADAEDALQATFVVAMGKAAAFDPRTPIGPWLAGILANEARTALRRERRRASAELPERPAIGDPAADAERRELVATLRTHIEALPAEQRQVLLLQLQYGLQPAEIAEIVAAPPGTVRMRLHRGLQALRAVLPASLVATFAALLPSRGIAAVRASVLRTAATADAAIVSGSFAGAVVAAGAATKQALLAAAALLLAVFAWWLLSARDGVLPAPSRPDHPVAQQVAAGARDAAADAGAAAAPGGGGERSAGFAAGSVRATVLGNVGYRRPQYGVIEPQADAPLADVVVEVRSPPDAPLDRRIRARTNAAGEALFADLAPGAWELTAIVAAACATSRVVVPAGGEVAAELRLPFVDPMHGRVLDARGQPVAGAEIVAAAVSPSDSQESYYRVAAISGADGTFACACVGDEERLGAKKEGFANSWTHPVTRFDCDGPVTLVLGDDPGRIAIDVDGVDATSADAVCIDVVAEPKDLRRAADGTLVAPPLGGLAQHAGGGRFVADGLAAATYRCRIRVFNVHSGAVLRVAPGHTQTARLSRPQDMVVRGRVVGARGEPKAGAVVGVVAARRSDRTKADAEGTFCLSGVARAPVTVIATGEEAEARVELAAPPVGDLRCEIVLDEPPPLAGRVVDRVGRAQPRWWVTARAGETVCTVPVRDDGTFTIRGLRGDTVEVAAHRTQESVGEPVARLAVAPSMAQSIVLTLPDSALPSAGVRGRVVDGAGRAIPGAFIALQEWVHRGTGAVAADGTFEFDRLDGGSHELFVRAPGRVACLREVTLPRDQHVDVGDVVLEPAAELRVRFLRPDGSPWRERPPAPCVEPVGAPGCWFDHRVAGDAVVVSGLPPGRYSVGGPADGELLVQPRIVDLAAGASIEIVLPTAIGRLRELHFEMASAASEVDPVDVQIRRAGGEVAVQRTLTRSGGPSFTVVAALPVGDVVVEARRAGAVTHRAEITVGSKLDDWRSITVPPVR